MVHKGDNMRKMRKGNQEVAVIGWAMTKNFWEYYILEKDPTDPEITFCLVDGYCQELGYVDLREIRPYISAMTTNLHEIQAAPGWDWVDV